MASDLNPAQRAYLTHITLFIIGFAAGRFY